jgi:hypothetical protein
MISGAVQGEEQEKEVLETARDFVKDLQQSSRVVNAVITIPPHVVNLLQEG